MLGRAGNEDLPGSYVILRDPLRSCPAALANDTPAVFVFAYRDRCPTRCQLNRQQAGSRMIEFERPWRSVQGLGQDQGPAGGGEPFGFLPTSQYPIDGRLLRITGRHQSGLVGEHHRLRAVTQTALGEHVAEVGFDRCLTKV